MIKYFFAILLCVMTFTTQTFAEEAKVTPLKKGQFAPWSGVLFSNKAAAEVISTYKSIPNRIEIERKNEREKCDAKCKKFVSDMLARHDREMSVVNARVNT